MSQQKKSRPLLLLLVLALAAGGGWYGWQHYTSANTAVSKPQLVSVSRGTLEDSVAATGTLQPRDYVDVGAQVSGQLKKIHVEVGSEVQEGDLLGEIDATIYLSKVDATRAQLRNLRATLQDREAQLKLSRIQLRRQQALLAEDATTAESVQVAEANAESAAASLEALRAQIDQTESTLRADEANLQYSSILSPMSGTVVSISARQGQTLNTNQQAPTILRIADLSTMVVETQVSEADISRLRLGMEAYFTTLGSQGRRWRGTLSKIEPTPTVTNNVVLYNALFEVPNESKELMTQMTAQVYFVIAHAENALLLPMSALRFERPAASGDRDAAAGDAARPPRGERRPEGRTEGTPSRDPEARSGQRGEGRLPGREARVSVLNASGSLEERTVRVGVSNRINAQILSGLEEGDQVALAAAARSNSSAPRPPMGPRL